MNELNNTKELVEDKLLLSICIPIYNFGKFISETLDSVLAQIDSNDEVIVVDGGSQDNTQEILHPYMQKHPNLRYHRFEQKGGIDVDMEKSVSLASGKYCWLFSGDDIMLPGSINKIKEQLKLDLDVYICSFDIYSFDMQKFVCKHPIFKVKEDKHYNLHVRADRRRYFREAIHTPAFFSFMSALVIKRSTWEKAGTPKHFMNSCWGHAARLMNYLKNHGLQVKFLADIYLKKRDENDSFLDKGLIYRFGIAIYGYLGIADKIFGRFSFEAFHIRRVMRYEFPLSTLHSIETHSLSHCDTKNLSFLIKTLYRDFAPSAVYQYLRFRFRKTLLFKILRVIKRLVFFVFADKKSV